MKIFPFLFNLEGGKVEISRSEKKCFDFNLAYITFFLLIRLLTFSSSKGAKLNAWGT